MAEYGLESICRTPSEEKDNTWFKSSGIVPYAVQIPQELDVPSNLFNPIFETSSTQTKDLILLSEFSEIEGPVPLVTIPYCGIPGVDINELPVKLMSTDYNNSLSGTSFNIAEDTQVLEEPTDDGHYIYAHYFVLYDVRARGFIRPMCLAYLTKERYKLIHNLSKLKKEFCEVTDFLKASNLDNFSNELTDRHEDLLYTKERFIFAHKHFPKDQPKYERKHDDDLEESDSFVLFCDRPCDIERIQSNHTIDEKMDDIPSTILHDGTSYNSGTSDEGRLFSTAKSLEMVDNSQSSSFVVPKVNFSEHSPLFNNPPHDDSIEAIPIAYTDYITPKASPEAVLEVSGSSTSTLVSVKGLSYSVKGSLAVPFCKKDSEIKVSSLMYDECASYEDTVSEREERVLLQHTSLDALATQLLDCKAILQVVQSYLESCKAKKVLEEFLSDLLCKSTCILYEAVQRHNLLNDVVTTSAKKQHTPKLFIMTLMRRNFKTIRSIQSLCNIGYVAAMAKLLSIYNIFSQSNTNLLLRDLDAEIADASSGSLFMGNIPIITMTGMGELKRNPKFHLIDYCWDDELIQLLNVNLSKISTPDSEYEDAAENIDGVPLADDCLELFSLECAKFPTSPMNSANQPVLEMSSHKTKESDRFQPSTPTRRSSESGDSLSSGCSSLPNIGSMEHISKELDIEGEEETPYCDTKLYFRCPYEDINSRMLKSRLSTLIQQFCSVSPCILHSILSGRTMIVAGPDSLKAAVLYHTKALSSILPNVPHQSAPVLKWHSGTVTPYHLLNYRIIGLCIPERLHVQDLMSNATLNKVTVLNIETGHISGVAYSGSLLRGVDHLSQRHFRSDPSLQAALQSSLIHLGLKVFLLFHLLKTTTRSANDILKGIGVSRGDWQMVTFLVNLVQNENSWDNIYRGEHS